MTVLILEKTTFQKLLYLLNSAETFQRYRPLKMAKNIAKLIFSIKSLFETI